MTPFNRPSQRFFVRYNTRSLDAVMVSQHFWPQLLGEDMKLHPTMEKRLSEFSKAYSVIKNPRLLVWKKQVKIDARRAQRAQTSVLAVL